MRLIAAWALMVCASHAQIVVEETATRARLVNGITTVSLALRNAAPQPIETRVDLEWLDPNGVRCRAASFQYSAPPGAGHAETALPLQPARDVPFWRLHYKVQPQGAPLALEGMLAFARIAEHAFHLSAFGVGTPRAGRLFEFRVIATHPRTGRPVPGVTVSFEKVSAKTDSHGNAVLRVLPDPDTWDTPDTETIRGELGDLAVKTEAPRPGLLKGEVRITTDKPLYQPGQVLHARILALDDATHARKDACYTFRFRDDRSRAVFSQEVKTSRFGIASADWEIPESTESGRYQVVAEDAEGDTRATREVEIRRYELPSFRVAVTPDRAFYLPGQTAAIEVRADYLFGKPLAAGTVRITEANSDKPLHQGELDANGRFHAVLDLSDSAGEVESARFVDLHYTASVTEAASNRTEQRPFDLRLSRETIHVYTLGAQPHGPLYVSAYTPDGKPAICDVEVRAGERKLAAARTNRFGLARLDLDTDADEVTVIARSSNDRGSETVTLGRDSSQLRLETDRALYRAGESVRCRIESGRKDLHATLLAWGEDGQVLYSRALHLKDGRAEASIPYDARAGRELSIAVASPFGPDYQAGRVVLFPGKENLVVTAQPARPSYRPGERASIFFNVAAASGAPAQAALGISVVDRAVWERAAADSSARETQIAGFTAADLKSLDPAKIDADYQLVAEAMLNRSPLVSPDSTFLDDQREAYHKAVRAPLASVRDPGVLDPWLRPYRTEFSIDGADYRTLFVSSGPDKIFGTDDDLEALELRERWFLPTERAIRDALAPLADYPATAAEFSRVIHAAGIDFESLRDPWGNTLSVAVRHYGAMRAIELWSAGPDRIPGTGDDVHLAGLQGSYFGAMRTRIARAIDAAKPFPTDEARFRAALATAGIDLDTERDPWGHRYYPRFRTEPYFDSNVRIYTWHDDQQLDSRPPSGFTQRRSRLFLEILSPGADGIPRTYDDAIVAEFTHVVDEAGTPESPTALPPPAITPGGTGAIEGVVTDATGAGVPNTEVTLNDAWRTRTGARGEYAFRALPPGRYQIRVQAAGFRLIEIHEVPVQSGRATRADVRLEVGQVNESVTVTAEAPVLQTDTAMLAVAAPQLTATATPRVRDYFPETLVWNPELVTDASGRATLRFPMADSITEWRVAVIASTIDGRIAETSASVKSFQPFFVDLDPPGVLTEGDRIALPVPVRNYLASEKSVTVDVTPPAALSLDGPARQTVHVAPNASAAAIVRLRASSSAIGARLRAAAHAPGAADAIEKPVTIHPDGEPVTRTVSDLLDPARPLRIETPPSLIPGSLRAEVRIYSSLLPQVREAAESLLQKPHGCGEQTVSSTWPNLLFLTLMKQADLHDAALEARAQRNLSAGYQRLLGYQAPEGGFGYWSGSRPDHALTLYALEFLDDADDFLEIEPSVPALARAWLKREQPTPPREETPAEAVVRLRSSVRDANGEAFWPAPASTPFHSWGRAAVVETTALAVTALARWRDLHPEDAGLPPLVNRGVLYLLRAKDEFGTWHNTHATIRTLQALIAAVAHPAAAQEASYQVRVNGIPAGRITDTLDVSRFMKPGASNEVAIDAADLVARFTARWYEPWRAVPQTGDVSMTVRYSTAETAIGQPVRCDVTIARARYTGYGMMIAEVGLPPGVEVDRASLLSPWVQSVEVEPGKVVFYVWPQEAASLSFTFRPRFAMQARTAPSALWDYYNPDARVVVAPATLTVR